MEGSQRRISTKEGATDDPPAFEEMLRTPPVFFMFLSFLIDQMATENLFFLQMVRFYRVLKRPQPEIDDIGRTIMCIYCLPGAPAEVNISAETRASLCQAFLQPCLRLEPPHARESPSVYTPTLFDTAYDEIRLLLTQPYTEWLATNEWKRREILNYIRRLKPPSFSTVLNNNTLCDLFQAFLRERVAEDSDELDSFLFCVDAERFRQTSIHGTRQASNNTPESTRPRKMSDASAVFITVKVPESTNRTEYSPGNNSDDELSSDTRSRRSSEAARRKEDLIMGSSEAVSLEKMARTIVKKHRLPKKSKQLSYRLHLSSQFDRMRTQWTKNEIFIEWQNTKQWSDVAFKDPVSLRQTKNSSGFMEYPSLAATVVSLITDPHRSGNGLGVLFKYIMNYSSYPKDLDFMEAVLKFRKKFSSESADKEEMVEAASIIFNTYLVPVKIAEYVPHTPCPEFLCSPLANPNNCAVLHASPHGSPLIPSSASPDSVEMPLVVLDNSIINELRGILWSSAKTKVHPDMFRRAATYVYHRGENSWFRELCASYLWVNREYENESEQTERVRGYLGDYSIIENVIDTQAVPILYDDIVENSSTYLNFMAIVPSTRKQVLEALDRISAFRMKPVQTLREACALRSVVKKAGSDNLVVMKLIKNMKSYLDMENVAAPFHDDGSSTPPNEASALVNNAIFDFIRSSLNRQLLAECGDKFISQRTGKKVAKPARVLHFFKYVEPFRLMEVALVTKNPVQSQGMIVVSPSGTTSSSKNAKNSSNGSSGSASGGIRTPIVNVMPASFTLDSIADFSEEPPPTVFGAPGKKSGILGFLRGTKARHSPLVKHVRAPGSADTGFIRSPDALYSSPKVGPADPTSNSHKSKNGKQSSIVMNVPSFDEVLGSTYFRSMLTDYYFGRVEEDESNAWDDLTQFYSKFSKADDVSLANLQEAAIKHANSVIERNREFLSCFAADLEKVLNEKKSYDFC